MPLVGLVEPHLDAGHRVPDRGRPNLAHPQPVPGPLPGGAAGAEELLDLVTVVRLERVLPALAEAVAVVQVLLVPHAAGERGLVGLADPPQVAEEPHATGLPA